jgi:hypothetical protein
MAGRSSNPVRIRIRYPRPQLHPREESVPGPMHPRPVLSVYALFHASTLAAFAIYQAGTCEQLERVCCHFPLVPIPLECALTCI